MTYQQQIVDALLVAHDNHPDTHANIAAELAHVLGLRTDSEHERLEICRSCGEAWPCEHSKVHRQYERAITDWMYYGKCADCGWTVRRTAKGNASSHRGNCRLHTHYGSKCSGTRKQVITLPHPEGV